MSVIYAHRGASGYAPENTMEAFLQAIANGADGFELDVHLSKDGVVVVMHDETVDRTTNGTGYIKDLTFEELRALDCNNHQLMRAQCVIPSLEEVIVLAKENKMLLNIEIKTDQIQYENIEKKVYDLVERYDYQKETIYSSFNPFSLIKLKEINKKAQCGFLYSIDLKDAIKIALILQFDALHPHYNQVTEKFVQEAHENHLKVNTWTVNEVADIEKCLEYGADGLITNYPDRIKEIIG